MRKYIAERPKQGSRRFNSIVKTKHIDDLGIVCLWLEPSRIPPQDRFPSPVGTPSCVSTVEDTLISLPDFQRWKGFPGFLALIFSSISSLIPADFPLQYLKTSFGYV